MSSLNIEHKTNKSIFIFLLIAITIVFLVTVTYLLTKSKIETNKDNYQRVVLDNLLKSSAIKFDNNILDSVIYVSNNQYLNSVNYNPIFIAKNNNKISAIIIETIAPDGYNGNISILVAISPDFQNIKNSKIINIKITNHEETPGLGDKADEDKYYDNAINWLKLFHDKSLADPNDATKWTVKKDNKDAIIDSWTGATITPRAITKAVYNSLKFFEKYHKEIINTQINKKSLYKF